MDSIIEDAIEDAEDDLDSETVADTAEDADNTDSTDDDRLIGQDAERNVSGSDTGVKGISDEELQDVLADLQTTITVVGCGGAGNNTLTRMVNTGIEGAEFIAANTDAQHLVGAKADEKLLIGKKLTKGRGAGAEPQIGEQAAIENEAEVEAAVEESDMVFVTAGMGGGTGTGAAPVVAEKAQESGALTISVVTTPFVAEGEDRRKNAEYGLSKLREVSDTVIVVPNERLLDEFGDLPVRKAFRVADEVLMRSVKGITELITKPGLVNLDFADVTTVMENGGVAMIGLGEAEGRHKARDSVTDALESSLLDVDISRANGVLVNVSGGNDMAIEEAEGVVEQVHDKVDPDARIIWGTSVDEELDDKIQTMLVITGVDSPQMYSESPDTAEQETQQSNESPDEEEDDGLGDIDFVE